MGGLEGSQITVEYTGSGEQPAATGQEPDATNLMDLPPGTLGIVAERRLWIAFFDTDEGLLAIMVGGPIDGWDEALAVAEPVLESVDIEQ
jgi:hypothetical protein